MTWNVGITGAGGRMAEALVEIVLSNPEVALAGLLARPGSPRVGRPIADTGQRVHDNAAALFQSADVVIDFTAPDASIGFAHLAAETATPLVLGTTGFDAGQEAALVAAARHAAILQAANFSLGVTLLTALVRQAAAALDTDWDIEILEMHHRQKVDAPSGTALMLGRAAAAARGVEMDRAKVTQRDGVIGPRPPGSIGFATLRGGTVPGDHSVIFAGPDERLVLSHSAGDRAIFARGAVAAARWLADKAPGRYQLTDMLGL
ncbi:MAG: 4-hydroxy-tetrahydrodipicolinate reductase [Rhodothalassiaceae bacterium]